MMQHHRDADHTWICQGLCGPGVPRRGKGGGAGYSGAEAICQTK